MHRALVEESLLQPMKLLIGGEPFDGGDFGALRPTGWHQTRHHRHPVEEDGAGSALAFSASFLAAGEIKGSQPIEEGRFKRGCVRNGVPVDPCRGAVVDLAFAESYRCVGQYFRSSPRLNAASALSVAKASSALRYSAVARRSPIGLAAAATSWAVSVMVSASS